MIKKSRHTKRNVTWGFGLAATAIGTYFLYGKEKIKNRRKVKGWMLKVKGEVLENLCENENIRKPYMDIVHAINAELSNFEQIKKFELVPYDLAKDHEVLTPTLKLKKKLVAQKFKSLIEPLLP